MINELFSTSTFTINSTCEEPCLESVTSQSEHSLSSGEQYIAVVFKDTNLKQKPSKTLIPNIIFFPKPKQDVVEMF